MSLQPNENVITFKSRFTKLARQISPAPGDSVLSSRYIEAITRQTGSLYDDCVSGASAIGGLDNFLVFSNLLTRLCTQKAARMTTQREASARPSQLNALMTRMESLQESMLSSQMDAHYSAEGKRTGRRRQPIDQSPKATQPGSAGLN